jgi:DNA-binding MarR family transcriptional regulator
LLPQSSTPTSQASSKPLSRRVGKYEWIDALNRVFDQRLEPSFNDTTRAVAVELFTFMGSFGDRCFPSVETLARRMRRKPETIVKHRNRLEARGYLEIRHGGGRGRPSHYYAVLPVAAAEQAPLELEPPTPAELPEAFGGELVPELVPDTEHDVLITAAGVELVPAAGVQELAAAVSSPAG